MEKDVQSDTPGVFIESVDDDVGGGDDGVEQESSFRRRSLVLDAAHTAMTAPACVCTHG